MITPKSAQLRKTLLCNGLLIFQHLKPVLSEAESDFRKVMNNDAAFAELDDGDKQGNEFAGDSGAEGRAIDSKGR